MTETGKTKKFIVITVGFDPRFWVEYFDSPAQAKRYAADSIKIHPDRRYVIATVLETVDGGRAKFTPEIGG